MPPRRRTLLVSLALSLLPLPADAGTRSFTISNLCSFAVWPAVTNWVQPATNEGYKGLRGWEAPPGNETTIRVPSPWIGRICAWPSHLVLPVS